MGDPKAGKSLMTMHMIMHLISGTPWFGCAVKRRVRVGLVTREDAPGLTKKRMLRMIKGSNLATYDLENWLWVNSRRRSTSRKIPTSTLLSETCESSSARSPSSMFSTACTSWMKTTTSKCPKSRQGCRGRFGAEVGCQIGLVHHINKDTGNANVFNRRRGAGALHGWMEWGLAVTVRESGDDESQWIRRVDLDRKKSRPRRSTTKSKTARVTRF